MFVIFFDIHGPVMQLAVPDRESLTGLFYKEKVLKKLKKKNVLNGVQTPGLNSSPLLHDNAPAHKSTVVTSFLKKERVRVLPHAPYSPDLAPLTISCSLD